MTPSKFYVIIQPNIGGFPPPDVYFDIVLIASTTSTIKLRIAVISSIMSVALCILSPLFFFFRLLNALTSFLYIVKGFSAFSLKNYIFRVGIYNKKGRVYVSSFNSMSSSIAQPRAFASLYTVNAPAAFISFTPCS